MEQNLNKFFLNENVDINLTNFAFNLLIVSILSYLIRLVYNK